MYFFHIYEPVQTFVHIEKYFLFCSFSLLHYVLCRNSLLTITLSVLVIIWSIFLNKIAFTLNSSHRNGRTVDAKEVERMLED